MFFQQIKNHRIAIAINVYFLLFFCIVWLLPAESYSSEYEKSRLPQVYLHITAPDSFKHELSLCLIHEVRKAKAKISKTIEKSDWILEVLASELKTVDDENTGIVYSTIVLKPFSNKWLTPLIKKELKPETALGMAIGADPEMGHITDPVKYVRAMTEDLFRVVDHSINYRPGRHTPDSCRTIVLSFEERHLKPFREMERHVQENVLKSSDQLRQFIDSQEIGGQKK